ncbi:MAG TPA: hypothetical protein PLC54_07125, partial [Spirochaetales bacterium]|nr:hypothetical protein [Spirochaetales bacterium]
SGGVRTDRLRIGLSQLKDGGGAEAYLRTIADTISLNLASSAGIEVVMLGEGDQQAAAERELCSYYLVPECSVSAGKLTITTRFHRTLGSDAPQLFKQSSSAGVDLFDSIDRMVVAMVSSFVGTSAGFNSMLQRGDEGARFSDPLEEPGEHWLGFGKATMVGGEQGYVCSNDGMFLLEPYQEGLSELSARLRIDSGSAYLYWDYLGLTLYKRLEIDLVNQELRLRSPWSLEKARLPQGSVAKGVPFAIRLSLSFETSEVFINGKSAAKFLAMPRPLGRAGFGSSQGGSASFRDYSVLLLEDSTADNRLGGTSPDASKQRVPLIQPVVMPDTLAAAFRLEAPLDKPIALSISDDFSPKPDSRWRFSREVWTESYGGSQSLSLNPNRGMAYASMPVLCGDIELSGSIALASWKGDDQWAGAQWSVPEVDGTALNQGGYFFTLRKDGAVALYKGPLSMRPQPVLNAVIPFDPA